MKMRLTLSLAVLVAAVFSSLSLRAEDAPDAMETRLREALRAAMQQVNAQQAELATLRAAQTTLTDEKKALNEQIEVLRKHGNEDRAAAEKQVAALKKQLEERDADVARLTGDLAKWKSASNDASRLAESTETERARLEIQNHELERLAAERRTKNVELAKVANEILARYEKFGLGEALAAKEPFVGRTRTRLENLVQNYENKIADQKVTP